ncbi:MAG TPA: hypothetical protein VIJ29_04450 [Candidatus Paceibacterota bacterium]
MIRVNKGKKGTMYFIGGLARTGKTTIAEKVARKGSMLPISADAIRSGTRNLLIGEYRTSMEKISFKTIATFRRAGSSKIYKKRFGRNDQSEDELAWESVIGLIHAYDGKPGKGGYHLLVEGVAVTPEHLKALKLKNLNIKAAFIGYSHPSHVESILTHAKKKKDWVHQWIKEGWGNEADVHGWVRTGIIQSAKMKKMSKRFGYGYFDVAELPFEKHVQAVTKYLLKK